MESVLRIQILWVAVIIQFAMCTTATNDSSTSTQVGNTGVYAWSAWGAWTPCSRTCGGGVAVQKRECLPRPSSSFENTTVPSPNAVRVSRQTRGADCVGVARRYHQCNMVPCHGGGASVTDMRAEQCSAYDRRPFRGRFYTWVPYIDGESPCTLNCRPLGKHFYASLALVADGTPCTRPGLRAICVQGSCKCLAQSRSHKILALIPVENACSDDGSDSDEEINPQAPTQFDSDDSSDPPSLSSSLERLNLLDCLSDEDEVDKYNQALNSQSLHVSSLSPIIEEVLPSPSTVNYDALPTLNSIQSVATPSSVEHSSPLTTRATRASNKLKNASPHSQITPRLRSPSSSTRDALPTLNFVESVSSVSSPAAPEYSPHPSISTPTTRASIKRKKTLPRPKTLPAKKAKLTRMVLNYKWSKTSFKHNSSIDDEMYQPQRREFGTALDYFYLFLTPEIMSDIVNQTNVYSVQEQGKSIQLSVAALKTFIGMQILMGIVQMPAYTDYWARKTRYPLIADQMPLKRYQQIRRYLHFVDNSFQNSDRYFKIRPVMEKIRQNFLKLDEESCYSIDEMMIPYKGCKAGTRRQYVKNKPKKWGFKNFVRAGVSGLIFDFIMYGGDDTFRGYSFSDSENSTGLGGKIVIALCQSIQKKPAYVYADNFFTSPELIYILRHEYGLFGLGTIRSNRLRGCQDLLPSDKEMKKKNRGHSAQAVCNTNKIAVVKWHDNKAVTLISSFVDSHPMESIKRYSKETKTRVDVSCPQIVKLYNKHMGGVDLADMLISLYRTPLKTRRWYMGIFAQLLDMCINNAWLLHRRDSPKAMTLKNFRIELSEGLYKANKVIVTDENEERVPEEKKIQKAVKERPSDSVRFDGMGHLPESGPKNVRCRYCKDGRTKVFCIKCNMPLCFVVGETKKRNCFRHFHTK